MHRIVSTCACSQRALLTYSLACLLANRYMLRANLSDAEQEQAAGGRGLREMCYRSGRSHESFFAGYCAAAGGVAARARNVERSGTRGAGGGECGGTRGAARVPDGHREQLHAALNVAALFHGGGRPVYLLDAAELVSHATLPRESALIVISRSGRSVEIVQLLEKARASGAAVIGVTNAPEGTLAREAQFPLVYATEMDHAISVVTYTTLALTAGLLASAVLGLPNGKLASELSRAIAEAEKAIAGWQKQLETPWLAPGVSSCFCQPAMAKATGDAVAGAGRGDVFSGE